MIRSSRLGQMALGLLVLVAGSASLPAVDIYVLTNNSINNSPPPTNFGKIDSTTGAYTNIASFNLNLQGLAWGNSGQSMYVWDGTTGASSSPMMTLTTGGTLSASIGMSKAPYGAAYRMADSTMYVMNPETETSSTVNLTNGVVSSLNSTTYPVNSPTGGAYAILNDTLYFAYGSYFSQGSGRFGTLGFGAGGTFSQLSADPLYGKMNIVSDGTTLFGIYGNGSAGQQKLYTINPATGALTAGPTISGTGLGTYFHGAAIVPVPEPSTYALGAIATGVMAAVARRRKARKG